MTRRTQENVIAGLLVAVFAAYLFMTLSLGPNARLVPVPIALLGLGFLLIQIVSQNRSDGKEFQLDLFASLTAGIASNKDEDQDEDGDRDDDKDEESTPEETPPAFPRELQALGFLAAFIGLVLLLGPIAAVFLFTSGYFLATRHFAPLKAVTVAGLCTLALYLLFAVGLQLQMYHGVLAPFFEAR